MKFWLLYKVEDYLKSAYSNAWFLPVSANLTETGKNTFARVSVVIEFITQ